MSDILTKKIDEHIIECYRKNTFTHCSVAILYKDNVVYKKNFEDGNFVNHKIYYDIASITKPTITMPIFLQIINRDDIDLHNTIYPFFESLQNTQCNLSWMKKVTFFDLLTHISGLPPVTSPSLSSCYKDDLLAVTISRSIEYLLCTKPIHNAKEMIIYSCVNFLLLGIFLYLYEKKTMQQLINKHITTNQDLIHTPKNKNLNYAPTEYHPFFGRKLKGEVHDPTAYCMKEISGNAGVFSTIEFYMQYIRVTSINPSVDL